MNCCSPRKGPLAQLRMLSVLFQENDIEDHRDKEEEVCSPATQTGSPARIEHALVPRPLLVYTHATLRIGDAQSR